MTGKRVNKFKKINHHLKSKQIDEKIELLSEVPTNNTGAVYIIEPEYYVQDPDYLDDNGDVDYTQDDPELNGRDTTGLFASDGTILTEEPPGDTSYVLGPMSSMYYTYTSPSFTTIGYIRQSDRKMVNLGRITGQLENWDGSSNFISYGQLTLEQAVWFRDIEKVDDYRAYYPGPPSGSPDAYGRYRCKITGKPKPRPRTPPERRVPPVGGPPEDAGFPWGFPWGGLFGPKGPKNGKKNFNTGEEGQNQGENELLKTFKKLFPGMGNTVEEIENNMTNLSKFLNTLGMSGKTYMDYLTGRLPSEINNKYLGQNYVNDAFESAWILPDGRVNVGDTLIGSAQKPEYNPKTGEVTIRFNYDFKSNEELLATEMEKYNTEDPVKLISMVGAFILGGKYGFDSMPVLGAGWATWAAKLLGKGQHRPGKITMDIGKLENLNPKFADQIKVIQKRKELGLEGKISSGTLLTESRKKILREIKQPYKLPEAKKEKIKHRPKVIGSAPRVVGGDMMKKAECPTSFKPIEEKMWGKYEKNKNSMASQERKNQVLDLVGTSDHAWEWITETKRNKLNDIMYTNFNGKDKQYKVVRKEEMKGDTLLFIVDENGKKENILQSQLNDRIANEFDREIFSDYFAEQETAQVDTDPLFGRVKNRLKQVIDYPEKPAKAGYPNDPPPEMVNGWHPEYGKDRGYYNKLDPQSAAAMPSTGNPEIDAKVQKAKRLKEIVKKKA